LPGDPIIFAMTTSGSISAVPDLPIGYIGSSLGPQDPRGLPTNWCA